MGEKQLEKGINTQRTHTQKNSLEIETQANWEAGHSIGKWSRDNAPVVVVRTALIANPADVAALLRASCREHGVARRRTLRRSSAAGASGGGSGAPG